MFLHTPTIKTVTRARVLQPPLHSVRGVLHPALYVGSPHDVATRIVCGSIHYVINTFIFTLFIRSYLLGLYEAERMSLSVQLSTDFTMGQFILFLL